MIEELERLNPDDEPRWRPCVRSGLCCKTAVCVVGMRHGEPAPVGGGPCSFLRGDRPGFYSCGLVDDGLVDAGQLDIGAGCCMPLFNQYRREAIDNGWDGDI